MSDHQHAPEHTNHESTWDERAPEYAANSDQVEFQLRPVTETLLDAAGVGTGTRLLDLACGPGHSTSAAAARGAVVVGVDRSVGMVAAARTRFPKLQFEVGDMLTPPAGPWDAITCRFGAHHVDPRWLTAAHRVMRPGGTLAIAELGPEGDDEGHGKHEPEIWERRLQIAGFDHVKAKSLRLKAPAADAAAAFPVWDRTIWIISAVRP